MTAIERYVGNTNPPLVDYLKLDGAPFNLTGSTVTFSMRLERNSTLKVAHSPATVVDAVGGVVQHDWIAGEVDTPGDYMFWWTVTLPSTKVQDSPEFPMTIMAHDNPDSLINLANIRKHVETGLGDEALALLVDDATAEVEGRFGTDAPQTLRLLTGTSARFIRLPRPALSVTSIVELDEYRTPVYTLLAADYELMPGGRLIERLNGSFSIFPGRSWRPVVDIVYVPRPEAEVRARTIISLVRLATQYSGLSQENVGGRTGYINYPLDALKERERLLQAIPNQRGFRFA